MARVQTIAAAGGGTANPSGLPSDVNNSGTALENKDLNAAFLTWSTKARNWFSDFIGAIRNTAALPDMYVL